MEQLEKQLADNLAEELKKEEERKKRLPEPVRIGPGASLHVAAEKAAVAAFSKVKHNRAYAVETDPVARMEFGALAVAAQRHRVPNFPAVLEKLGRIITATIDNIHEEALEKAGAPKREDAPPRGRWLQIRPADDAGTIPALPVDSTTGQRVRNPWSEPHDFKSQNVIREWSSRLATWLEAVAENNGPTAAMLDELEGERLEAEAVRKIQYGTPEWQANKCRKDSGATVTEAGEFTKNVDPWTLRFHRQEAKMASPNMGFDNLTICMAIAKADPELRKIHKAAHEIVKEWEAEARGKAA